MSKKMPHRTKLTKTRMVKTRVRLQHAFDEFLRAKRIEQLKPRTLEDHVKHFGYFTNWLNVTNPDLQYLDEISVHIVRDYIDYMMTSKANGGKECISPNEKGLSPVTINIRLRTLKCFFRWIYQEGLLEENPVDNIKLLKTDEDTIKGFTQEQIGLLLSQPDVATYVGFRDYCLMLFLLDTGARITEALNVTVHDLDFSNSGVYFPSRITKNRKAKTIPLSDKVMHALQELLEENEENFGKQEYVFLTTGCNRLEPYDVRRRVSMYGKQAGIHKDVRVSPHTFRHTFATMYIQNGGDIFTLQKILGHSSMDMVRKYVQMSERDLKSAHKKFSPLNCILIESE